MVGTVTLDGKPVENGTITLRPVDGNSPSAGAFIAKGAFSQRVPLGSMRVEITSPRVAGTKKIAMPGGSFAEVDVVVEAIPDAYNAKSTLVLDVKPGVNRVAYELKSSP